jgi:hypothetical protein
LAADEKITWLAGEEVLVATTVGAGCFLGVGLARQADTPALQAAYGEFKQEAQKLYTNYAPASVCTDGFPATRLAWRQLFNSTLLTLCYLHGVLKVQERCRGALRQEVLDHVWHCYDAGPVRPTFA